MNSNHREKTKRIKIGKVFIGGGSPVAIQSMTTTYTGDVSGTVSQIKELQSAGCDIIRVAVPDIMSAQAIKEIKKETNIPIVADIHFDYKLALSSIEAGADKIRINPGNIGGIENVRMVADACQERGIPIRIGVNGGSLEKELLEKYGGVTPEALVESAEGHIALLERVNFRNICVSLKSSSVETTVKAYTLMASKHNYPLHLGVTEAGTKKLGIIKGAAGIGGLLALGIGDTIRVSLTADPVEEVFAAKDILKAVGLLKEGIDFISCPTCGRCKVELIKVATEVEKRLSDVKKDIKVAVMGCIVNGPGEAKHADIGIAGGDGYFALFKNGQVVKKVPSDNAAEILCDEIMKM